MADESKPGRNPGRKAEQLVVSLERDVASPLSPGWEDVHLLHNCLPDLDRQEVDLSVDLLGHRLRYPIVISALTGGHRSAMKINAVLARAAEAFGLAMGVGSQRPYIESGAWAATYSVVRKHAPSAFLIANIGVPQLIPQDAAQPYSIAQIESAVSLIQANALAVHLNYLQEAVQLGGDVRAKGCRRAIGALVDSLALPVIAKETGAGMLKEEAVMLRDLGVAALDVGGAGGTSMPLVEAHRLPPDSPQASLARFFANWGVPTATSIVEARIAGLPVIATGGVRNGVEAAKALALGATAVGVGLPLLKAADQGYEATSSWLQNFIAELHTALFLTGIRHPADLPERALVLGKTREWLEARRLLKSKRDSL